MKTIVLKFSGPLQSWGTTAHFETRHTDFYPSKSAIIGLLAASLGYRREETDKIVQLNELSFGVRIDQKGELLKDYHTARKYKADGAFERTYVTERYYLQDAVFLVALSSAEDQLIDQISYALANPYFQPFMGRRSLPLPMDFIVGIYDSGLIEILQKLPWQAAKWYQKKHSALLDAFVDADLVQDKQAQLRKDRVLSFNQKNRQFAYRKEAQFYIDLRSANEQTAHDPFAYL
ncbi:type I-E CRISPR-associated protein Cas5/CasD [Atopobacter sp. AH10]|uniref:type I-E CRISPR-associated protein Cas5/CasD n=1 Tax=Atopobacter sp. AH10 TaxID=2315861 RepID=UPI000EF230D4|nr:type I-E CRISPR-associated protein Cas5/CasD [Atopobacter sp. AH10]RLK64291.1 type I-E CRISPR-associated protein Cas5/CasD [Atopobacter sp. AH10]